MLNGFVTKFNLGESVKDSVTGFIGKIIGIYIPLTGGVSYLLVPEQVAPNATEVPSQEYFEEGRLKDVGGTVARIRPGGAMRAFEEFVDKMDSTKPEIDRSKTMSTLITENGDLRRILSERDKTIKALEKQVEDDKMLFATGLAGLNSSSDAAVLLAMAKLVAELAAVKPTP